MKIGHRMPGSGLIQSVSRGLSILEAVARSEDGLTLSQLARQLGLKSPTVHNLARTLAARGFLRKVRGPLRYQLGERVGELATLAADNDLMRRAVPVVEALFARLGVATVTLVRPIGGEVLNCLRISPERPGVLERPAGRAMHPYGTASALLFQAFWPEPQRAAYRQRYPFWQYGAHLWGEADRLEAALGRIRRAGHVALPMPRAGTFLVAVPVVGARDELQAALGACVPQAEAEAAPAGRWVEPVLEAAAALAEPQAAAKPGQEATA
jgi:DNA-binding IclR family transcriptional regulator